MPNESPQPAKKPELDRAHVPWSEEMDSARWSLPPVIPVLIAFALLALGFGLYSYKARPGLISQGSIDAFKTYPIHTESARVVEDGGMVATPEKYDQMLVMAHVTIKNVSQNKPLYFKSIDGKLDTGTDAGVLTAPQSTQGDQDQFFGFYKQLADFRVPQLATDTQLKSGQSATGMVMFSYPIAPDVWKNRKDFTITIDFYDQKPIVLHAPQGS
jgi:hypothetical protein